MWGLKCPIMHSLFMTVAGFLKPPLATEPHAVNTIILTVATVVFGSALVVLSVLFSTLPSQGRVQEIIV